MQLPEWTDWATTPLQAQICDACGTVGCASGGYIHLSVLRDFVFWTTPRQGLQYPKSSDSNQRTGTLDRGRISFREPAKPAVHPINGRTPFCLRSILLIDSFRAKWNRSGLRDELQHSDHNR